jgi:hypothetical protein
MKRLLLACTALLGLSTAAEAQIPGLGSIPGLGGIGGAGGITCSNCYTQMSGTANAATEILKMIAQIEQLISIFTMLSGNTNVNSMMAVLNTAPVWNQMGSFGNVPVMVQGGGLSSMGASYYAANTIYMPGASTMPYMNTIAMIEQRQAYSLANIQGMASSLLVTSNTILTALHGLQLLVDQQPSNQTMAGINSRLASYNGNIQSQYYQLGQMQAMAQAQQQVYEQQRRQAAFCSSVNWFNDRPAYFFGAGPTVSGSGAGCTGGLSSGFGTSVGGIPVAGGSNIVLVGSGAGGVGAVGSTGALGLGTVGAVGGISLISNTGVGGANIPGYVTNNTALAGYANNTQGPLAGYISQTDVTDGGSTVNVSPASTTGSSSTGGVDFDQTVTPSSNAAASCTTAGGGDCTPAPQDVGCVDTGNSECGGLTYDDTAAFDPTQPISAIPPDGLMDGTNVSISPGADPTSLGLPTDITVFNTLPAPASLSGVAMMALLKPRRKRNEQLRMAA